MENCQPSKYLEKLINEYEEFDKYTFYFEKICKLNVVIFNDSFKNYQKLFHFDKKLFELETRQIRLFRRKIEIIIEEFRLVKHYILELNDLMDDYIYTYIDYVNYYESDIYKFSEFEFKQMVEGINYIKSFGLNKFDDLEEKMKNPFLFEDIQKEINSLALEIINSEFNVKFYKLFYKTFYFLHENILRSTSDFIDITVSLEHTQDKLDFPKEIFYSEIGHLFIYKIFQDKNYGKQNNSCGLLFRLMKSDHMLKEKVTENEFIDYLKKFHDYNPSKLKKLEEIKSKKLRLIYKKHFDEIG